MGKYTIDKKDIAEFINKKQLECIVNHEQKILYCRIEDYKKIRALLILNDIIINNNEPFLIKIGELKIKCVPHISTAIEHDYNNISTGE